MTLFSEHIQEQGVTLACAIQDDKMRNKLFKL